MMNIIVIAVFFSAGCLAAKEQPNIIFILADDLGWNDVSYNGMTDVRTPNIDALAAAGVTLTNYYTLPTCTPSRAALLTGLHPIRTGLQGVPLSQAAPAGLPLHYSILPQRLKDLNYSTHIVGKWDMGYFWRNLTPTYRGFDTHYGYWGGAIDYFQATILDFDKGSKYLNAPTELQNITIARSGIDLRDGMQPAIDDVGKYVTDLLTAKAVDVIRKHDARKPLFLYLSHLAVHKGMRNIPDTAPEKYTKPFEHIQDRNRRIFAAKLTALDQSVGKVVEALATSGMLANSVIVFSSDNGADVNGFFPTGGYNWPLRGQKGTFFEGGIKVPACVWSPHFEGGPRVEKGLVHILDWLPTLYKAAGGKVKNLGAIDGFDLWPTLVEGRPSPRTQFLVNLDPDSGASAIRMGDLKFVYGSWGKMEDWYRPVGNVTLQPDDNPSPVQRVLRSFYGDNPPTFRSLVTPIDCGARRPPKPSDCGSYPCLFNIVQDPCEHNNIAAYFPQKVSEIWSQLREMATAPPVTAAKDYKAGPMMHCGFWDTWLDDEPTMADCERYFCKDFSF